WWHVTFDSQGTTGPDPGISATYPILKWGSGGLCQDPFVREVQRDLGIRETGVFRRGTARAVHRFQRAHNLKIGPVSKKTWRALRKAAGTGNPRLPTEHDLGAADHPLGGE
ncbi:MAG: peptidoglycan-binding protein, partial [Actinobacteria bacterium]|nr:peptidoglycan-binding protein [Actinomycetota bacterium]